jgi:hypothetical protein
MVKQWQLNHRQASLEGESNHGLILAEMPSLPELSIFSEHRVDGAITTTVTPCGSEKKGNRGQKRLLDSTVRCVSWNLRTALSPWSSWTISEVDTGSRAGESALPLISQVCMQKLFGKIRENCFLLDVTKTVR